ncbi:hypothetical protein [Mesorhizobium sp.]|uniref:hypothetical protein n=1 Tax=Mesorhizobium sp. TaxID=1871066 RepID=UPI0025EEBDBA|nr:hypothetical protein [Mesorhizobium sp.]
MLPRRATAGTANDPLGSVKNVQTFFRDTSKLSDLSKILAICARRHAHPIPSPVRTAGSPAVSKGAAGFSFGGEALMRDLPRDIDADVVIEISRLLNDRAKSVPVPVHKLAAMIRLGVETGLTNHSIEELIVEMAATRGLPMLFDLPVANVDNVVPFASARRPR